MCCRPAGPTAASPHFDKDEKQAPCPVPTLRCRHCPAPRLRSHCPGAQRRRHRWSSRPGGTAEPLGRAWDGQHRERCFELPSFRCFLSASPGVGLTSDPPSCWTPPAPATSAKCVSAIPPRQMQTAALATAFCPGTPDLLLHLALGEPQQSTLKHPANPKELPPAS